MLAAMLTGCASNHHAEASADGAGNHSDARIVRGLTDSMRSQPHSFPGDRPR